MADFRFFNNKGPFLLAEIAEKSGCTLKDQGLKDVLVRDVSSLELAKSSDLTFLEGKSMFAAFAETKALVCVVKENEKTPENPNVNLIYAKEPALAFAKIATMFYPEINEEFVISDKATVNPTAKIGKNCRIDAGVVIEEGVEIGDFSVIAANTVVGRNVVIGKNCKIGSCVSISHCLMGDNVTIYTGVRIGQDGFGYVMRAEGHFKIPQLGRVVIGNNVDVGANSTIDRGAIGDTVIGDFCKIDNLVQIAHNVKLGQGCVFAAQAGVSGSCRVGNFVAVGGQAGLADHINIGDGVQIAAQSGLMRDVKPKETVMGSPAFPIKEFMRHIAYLQKICRKSK